ncbi:hypothetical protein M3J09_009760 [Ascochyta lentis]
MVLLLLAIEMMITYCTPCSTPSPNVHPKHVPWASPSLSSNKIK